MMEYVLVIVLLLILVAITQFNRLMKWSMKKKNFEGLLPAKHGSQSEQQFYTQYMAAYQNKQEPIIKAVLADIQFDPPIQKLDQEFVEFNLSPSAVNQLALANEQLSFSAKFSGTVIAVKVPLASVEWVVADEQA